MALAAPLVDWIIRPPEIGKLMQERFEAPRPQCRPFPPSFIHRIDRPLKFPLQIDVANSTVLQNMVSFVTQAIGEFIVFVGSLLFFLARRVQIMPRVVQVMAPRPTRLAALRVFRAIAIQLGAYLVTATFINVGLGVATGLMTWVLGSPNPLLSAPSSRCHF